MVKPFDRVRNVLVFTAHADDCEFFCGGLVAALAREGARIVEVIATDNGRGSFELRPAELVARSRDIEARAAAVIIGKKHVEFLGLPDGYLDETPKSELRRIFIEWIRRVRPDCVLSFDPMDLSETHPDHRAVARAAQEAVSFAHLPLFCPEQLEAGLEPYMTPQRAWFGSPGSGTADTVVDIGGIIDVKIDALMAHESQMRFAMDEWKMMVRAGGRFGNIEAMFDRDNPRAAVSMIIRTWASLQASGQPFEYGERYRVERVDDLFEPLGERA